MSVRAAYVEAEAASHVVYRQHDALAGAQLPDLLPVSIGREPVGLEHRMVVRRGHIARDLAAVLGE
jgi:hypothetical protein